MLARAFAPNTLAAILAYPWAVLSILPGTIRNGLFMDQDGTGMVLLHRSRPVLDILLLITIMVPVMLLFAGTAVAPSLLLDGLPGMLISLGILAVAFSGSIFLLPARGGSLFSWGPETPPGQRWEIAGLAQKPGTRTTAALLATRAVRTIPPPGSVVVATAGNDELLGKYQRHGFTPGPKRRVHKVVT